MTDVFISYARADREFVRGLGQKLAQLNRKSWVDWNDIPPTAEWLEEIYAGIEASDNFIFVISPASVGSGICWKEIEHAVTHRKRLIPIVYRRVEIGLIPAALVRLNFIFFEDADRFDETFALLLEALDTDLDWKRDSTRYLMRSREWERHEQDPSFLMRGKELAAAETWLKTACDKQQGETQDLHAGVGTAELEVTSAVRTFIERGVAARASSAEAETRETTFQRKMTWLKGLKTLLMGPGPAVGFFLAAQMEWLFGKSMPWALALMSLFSLSVAKIYGESERVFGDGTAYTAVKSSFGARLAAWSACAMLFDSLLLTGIVLDSMWAYLLGAFRLLVDSVQLAHIIVTMSTKMILAVVVGIVFWGPLLWWLRVRGVFRRDDPRWGNIVAIAVGTFAAWGLLTSLLRQAQLPPAFTPVNTHFVQEAGGLLIKRLAYFPPLALVIPLAACMLILPDEEDLLALRGIPVSDTLDKVRWNVYRSIGVRFLFPVVAGFMFVMLVPDSVRIFMYRDAPVLGTARYMAGPLILRLVFAESLAGVAIAVFVVAYLRATRAACRLLRNASALGWLENRMQDSAPSRMDKVLVLVVGMQAFVLIWSRGDTERALNAFAFGVGLGLILKGASLLAKGFRTTSETGMRELILTWMKRAGVLVFMAAMVILMTVGLMSRKGMLVGMVFSVTLYLVLQAPRLPKQGEEADTIDA
jgi:hypothetical protein